MSSSQAVFAALIKAFGILRDAGFKTFGAMGDGEVKSKARVYGVVLGEDPRITPEIIEQTATRYITGKVTVWHRGDHVPAPEEFPSASAFRDACVQTWDLTYCQIEVGTRIIEQGVVRPILKTIRRDELASYCPTPALEPRATPEKVAETKARIASLPANPMPTISGAVIRREPRPYNPEADAVLAQMAEIRRHHEGVDLA